MEKIMENRHVVHLGDVSVEDFILARTCVRKLCHWVWPTSPHKSAYQRGIVVAFAS